MITYDQVTPYKALLFYNVYGEIILEFLLAVFWITSFAGLAGYVMEIALPIEDIQSLADLGSHGFGVQQDLDDLAATSKRIEDACTAIAVLGAVVLCVCSPSTILPAKRLLTCSSSLLALANIMSLIAYIVRREKGSEGEKRTQEGASQPPRDPESSVLPEHVSPKMPTIFTSVDGDK